MQNLRSTYIAESRGVTSTEIWEYGIKFGLSVERGEIVDVNLITSEVLREICQN